jgi:hypothetical protein
MHTFFIQIAHLRDRQWLPHSSEIIKGEYFDGMKSETPKKMETKKNLKSELMSIAFQVQNQVSCIPNI